MIAIEHHITIRKMTLDDLKLVVEIHIEQFPDSRSTSLGRPYLRKMYRWFMEKQPGLSFVALEGDRVMGFVVGAIGGYGRKIFRYALPEIVLGLLTHPALIFRRQTFMLWRSYLRGLLPISSEKAPGPAELSSMRASLSSVAVASYAQGHGVGSALVSALEDSAYQLGVTKLNLSVRSDNLPARRLYENCKWVRSEDVADQGSVNYLKQLGN